MTDLAKIKWQCRRGSLELDLLLKQYLETRYPVAGVEEQLRFVNMLQLDDIELLLQLHTLENYSVH